MTYKVTVAVCAEIRTKHSTQSEHHVECLNVKPWWYVEKPLDLKMLTAILLCGFCIIDILYTGCAKIKKIIPAPKC